MASTVLAQYLESIPARELHFQPNPGNAGDSLISHATFQLLHKLGKRFHLFEPRHFEEGASTLLMAGGGNLTIYNHAGKFLRKYHRRAGKIIILPHTICGNEQLLADLGRNVDILCREKVSYEYVRTRAPRTNVLLMEDVAFELDVQESLAASLPGLRQDLISRRLWNGPVKNTARLLFSLATGTLSLSSVPHVGGDTLNSFRTDREKTSIPIPPDNIDVSAKFAYGTHDEGVCRYTAASVLQFLNRYAEIRTNRLHVAIAGALLGKKVQLFSNSYFKCKAVYDHSMAHRFPNVQWIR